MASFPIKSTQIILIQHLPLIATMLLFTIESSGVYIQNVVLKPWRISRSWAVAVSVLNLVFAIPKCFDIYRIHKCVSL